LARNSMRRIISLTAFCFALLIVAACQRAGSPAAAYVKYENDAAVPRISAQDAKKEVDAGNAIFVDSRGEAAFNAEHLPGAIVMTFNATDDAINALPKGKKIIVYCS